MIKYRLHHNRKKKLREDGTALIHIEIYKGTSRKYLSTDIYIQPQDWDEKTSRVSYTNFRADEYNVTIDDNIQKIVSILRKSKLMEKDLSVNDVIELINHDDSNSLTEFMTKEIEKDQRITDKTKKDLLNTRNRLEQFNSDARLQQIDFRFIVDFDNHLRSMGYSINTIGKLHKNLKRFLNLAIKYKLISQNDYPYRDFKVERENTSREALSMKEVIAIEELTYTSETVNDIVKDMFLFACYTGLRISDVIRLKPSYCKPSDSGWRLEFKTFKAKKMAYLPLQSLFKDDQILSRPEQILEQYYNDDNELVFPKLPESRINRHLKEIAKEAGISKKVTFHMGRHTFGTIMATKVPLPTLQNLMQHSDIKTTMIYVNMSNDMIDDSLGKVDWNN
ncbi:site-specific integrase [Crocinitomicaceae bacterium]|nr:site-specific integrase [Crocinitomicaceae bacterium]